MKNGTLRTVEIEAVFQVFGVEDKEGIAAIFGVGQIAAAGIMGVLAEVVFKREGRHEFGSLPALGGESVPAAQVKLLHSLGVSLRVELLIEIAILLLAQICAAVTVAAAVAGPEKGGVRTIEAVFRELHVVAIAYVRAVETKLAGINEVAVDDIF